MEDKQKNVTGSIIWNDLTVKNAEEVSKFYSEVVGWSREPVNMGEYHDFNMNRPKDDAISAGICHAKGTNANLPPQWLIYIAVDNIEESVKRCKELGGKIISPVKLVKGYGKYCVIKDPAGAAAALFEQENSK
jgi:uncharacterized protein